MSGDGDFARIQRSELIIGPEDFEFEKDTGVITIEEGSELYDVLEGYFLYISCTEGEEVESEPGDYYVTLVLEAKVEKYRSVTDLRDLTEEQVNKIATAQAVEAAILEYNYQFNLATQTQMGYHEIIYTATVTAISTIIIMAATYGAGSLLNSLGITTSTTSGKLLVEGGTKTVGPGVERMLLHILKRADSITLSSIAVSVLSEMGQEILLDPWIESTVSGLVRRAGGDAYMQMILSSLAESGRETLTGQSSSDQNQQDQKDALMSILETNTHGLRPTVQQVVESYNEYRDLVKSQNEMNLENSRKLSGASRTISFLSKAIGFTTSMFLGPVAALTYTTLTAYGLTEGISLKNVFKKVFNPIKIAISNSKVADYVRNNKMKVLGLIGMGVLGAIMTGIQVLLPALSGLSSFGSIGAGFGGFTIGMVDIKQKKSPNNDLDVETKELIDWYDNLPIDQRYQYNKKLPFEDEVINMDPTQFKTSYKGPYSQYFRYIKDRHNRYMGVKTVGKLLRIMKNMDYKGIVYKITQVYDDHGNRLKSGGIFITYGKIHQRGPIRIGSAQILQDRLKQYQYKSKSKPGNTFERTLGTHPMGIKAFRIEILAVCKTQKELLATEAFWTLYSNRISFGRGFDLSENDFFNPIIGGFVKGFQAYNIPRWELIKLVMQNKEKKEIQQYYTNKYSTTSQINLETINLRFDQHFGTHNLQDIRLRILKPLLEKCFKRGFDAYDALTYLKGSGIEWYSGPVNLRKQLSALVDDAVEIFGDQRSGIRSNRWDAIRTLLFTEPYVEFLRNQGVVDTPPSPLAGRNIGGNTYIDNDFSIIEYLLSKDIPPTEIAIQIGICQADDPKPVKSQARKMVYSYLTFKYENAFKEAGMSYNIENLRKFLKSHFIGDDLYW